MSPEWEPDIALDPAIAARLVEHQFPSMAPATLVSFGDGWDNSAYLVNSTHVFRFPRREWVVPWLANEAVWLPRLAPIVTLPIPLPNHVGRASGEFPYPFLGYPVLRGTTACRAQPDDDQRCASAATLGRFLASLHAAEPDTDGEPMPLDAIRRTDLEYRASQTRSRLPQLEDDDVDRNAVLALLAVLELTPAWDGPLRWVHGDLYARHVLVDDDGQPCGIIDFGDLHRGDPALDLMIAFTYLPPEARPDFREAYGPIDDDTWNRARFRALFYGPILIIYGRDIGDDALVDAGLRALRYALAD